MAEITNSQTIEKTGHLKRDIGLDVGRFVAVISMMFIHLNSGTPSGNAFEELARFSVPYFFMVAGFFQRLPDGNIIKNYYRVCSRLLKPFAFWLVLYLLFFRPPLESFVDWKYDLSLIIRGGPAYHLWFLTSLMLCSMMLMTLEYFKVRSLYIFIIGASLYILGLLLGPYYNFWSHMGRFGWDVRNGPFFGFPFMVLGWGIAKQTWQIGRTSAFAMALAGLALIKFETFSENHFHTGYGHDMLIGTVPFALGMFILLKSIRLNSMTARMAAIGRLSLGIYCVHLYFAVTVSNWPIHVINDTLTELVVWALVAMFSIVTCLLISPIKWANSIVQ